MQSVFISPAAENDLINIWIYIALDNPKAADHVWQEAENTFKALLVSPLIGTCYQNRRQQLQGVRFHPVSKFKNYMVYYREKPNGIEIIRILHSRMDKKKWLEK